MPELLSRGFEAEVYFITPEQKNLVPDADVVKDQFSKNPVSYLKSLYGLVIAHSLFPEHFIEVVAAQNYHPLKNAFPLISSIAYNLQTVTLGYRFLTYSTLATVVENHAIYTSHAVRGDRGRDKRSTLDCADCIVHNDVHRSSGFLVSMQQAVNKVADAGIYIPSDITDLCVNPENGKAMIFEIDFINCTQLRRYLNRLQTPISNETHIRELLQKYEELDFRTPQLEEWILL
ncbi:hypothetical protein HYW43_01335 [Candidatus Daviesbacteria bacterium]|nr:hypothetical protein [Candidatus Daviesbacteria bacterium]